MVLPKLGLAQDKSSAQDALCVLDVAHGLLQHRKVVERLQGHWINRPQHLLVTFQDFSQQGLGLTVLALRLQQHRKVLHEGQPIRADGPRPRRRALQDPLQDLRSLIGLAARLEESRQVPHRRQRVGVLRPQCRLAALHDAPQKRLGLLLLAHLREESAQAALTAQRLAVGHAQGGLAHAQDPPQERLRLVVPAQGLQQHRLVGDGNQGVRMRAAPGLLQMGDSLLKDLQVPHDGRTRQECLSLVCQLHDAYVTALPLLLTPVVVPNWHACCLELRCHALPNIKSKTLGNQNRNAKVRVADMFRVPQYCTANPLVCGAARTSLGISKLNHVRGVFRIGFGGVSDPWPVVVDKDFVLVSERIGLLGIRQHALAEVAGLVRKRAQYLEHRAAPIGNPGEPDAARVVETHAVAGAGSRSAEIQSLAPDPDAGLGMLEERQLKLLIIATPILRP
mmetsp:Transcript_49677/g.142128  ORF Transcript_49677/g.142128 Transcript_49677/m.142128 type:complete len:450 (-) Transcript_49677:174-1523(-)